MAGMKRMGRCLNNGRCELANSAAPIPLDPGAPFKCPDCRSELVLHLGKARKQGSAESTRLVLKVLVLPALVLLVGVGINFL
ncbi:MAG: hypothetical protein H7268_15600 [Sandarakinorhabdus sp.]|nr:hypothetical protein [Sandarakinorhabdus sp.]